MRGERGRGLWLALVVAAAAGVGAWLWLGGGLGSSGVGGGDQAGTTDPLADPLTGTGEGGTSAQGGPELAGLGRRLKGPGSLVGRVMRYTPREPVAEHPVQVTGTARDGTEILLPLITGSDGSFRASDVPAVDDLHLSIGAADDPTHRFVVTTVEPGEVRDLGTILLGAPQDIVGRVVDPLGRGIAEATVEVQPASPAGRGMFDRIHELFRGLGEVVKPLAMTTSEADGSFRLVGLAPGEVSVTAWARSYGSGVRAWRVGGEAGQESVLTIELDRARSASGVVLDGDGRPVPDARVSLLADMQGPDDLLGQRVWVTTDRAGRFEDAPMPVAPSWDALVLAQGFPPSMFKVPADAAAQPLEFQLGKRTQVEMHVTRADDRESLGEAQILLVFGEMSEDGKRRMSIVSDITDEDGVATMPAQPGPIAWIWIKHAKLGSFAWMGEGMPGGMAMGIEPPAGGYVLKEGHQRIDVVVRPPYVLHGVVRRGDGSPVAGASVSVHSMFGGSTAVLTDTEGKYRLPFQRMAVEFIPIVMRASAPGLVLADGQVSVQTLGKPKDEPIEQDLTLVPAVLVTGRVLSADGKPVAAVRVSAKAKTKDQDFDFTQMLGSPRGMQALTDTAGRYTLDGVAGGVKQLHMEAVTEDGLEAKSEPVDLPERGEVRIGDLRLPRTHTLEVTVVDDVGAPVAEAAVSVVLADRMFGEVRRRAQSNAQGKATLRDLPVGELTVQAAAPDYIDTTETVTITEDADPAPLRMVLDRGRTIEGKVFDTTGQPIAGVTLRYQVDAGEVSHMWDHGMTTDKSGHYVVRGVARNKPVTLIFSSDTHRGTRVTVEPGVAPEPVRLEPLSPETVRRLQELEKERAEAGQGFREALEAPEDERQERVNALQERLREINDEMERLREGGE